MAHGSGFLGSISTVSDIGWTAMIVAWKTRNTSRLINTTRQAPTVDSGQSTVLTYARRIAGHTDYIADVLLLLPDSTS